jgi:hypothetical protein
VAVHFFAGFFLVLNVFNVVFHFVTVHVFAGFLLVYFILGK